jgi:murein DD-endopeptidase MepM/ murein hydrolase activator NlpD
MNPRITQVYGCRSCLGDGLSERYEHGISVHAGVDVKPDGASCYGYDVAVYVTAAGTVERTVEFPASHGLGNTVILRHGAPLGYSLYGHLDSVFVRVGDRVGPGSPIGIMGNSSSTARRDSSVCAHVHFEIKDLPVALLPAFWTAPTLVLTACRA